MNPARFMVSARIQGWLCGFAVGLALSWTCQGALQFDCFPGYEAKMGRAGAWYPVGFELFNDGPSFSGFIEIEADGPGAVERIPIELPTNTRKRLTTARFGSAVGSWSVMARLVGPGGKVLADTPRTPIRLVETEAALLGALPGIFAGMPTMPETHANRVEGIPQALRLDPAFFPDNPIELEALGAIYLSTGKALELKEPQAAALLAWMNRGGRLIVAIDQAGDFNALPWLRAQLPGVPGGQTNAAVGREIESWARSGPDLPIDGLSPTLPNAPLQLPDNTPGTRRRGANPSVRRENVYDLAPSGTAFTHASLPLWQLRPRDGAPVAPGKGATWALRASRGRGQLVLLAFDPEHEPFRSAACRPWFWARMAGADKETVGGEGRPVRVLGSVESALVSLVETTQVRKLPLGLLLALLVAYLAVIGPFDYWWLRRIRRPMLTWVTFPAYVVLFSGLIYFIGFKLRSGQTEWNEMHLVDVLPQGSGANSELRGWSVGSLYSPQNRDYRLEVAAANAAVRPVFSSVWHGHAENVRLAVQHQEGKASAQLFVPVWTSQSVFFDWVDYASTPIGAGWSSSVAPLQIAVTNQSDSVVEDWWLVYRGRIYPIKKRVSPGQSAALFTAEAAGSPLLEWLAPQAQAFVQVSQQSGNVFASGSPVHLLEPGSAAVAASFARGLSLSGVSDDAQFTAVPGADLTTLVEADGALLFAWQPVGSPLGPIQRFSTQFNRRSTLYRLYLPPPPVVRG